MTREGMRLARIAIAGCGFMHGALAFSSGGLVSHTRYGIGSHIALDSCTGRRFSLSSQPRGSGQLRSAALYMQNAPGNAPNPLELLVKSQPSSREGIDLFVGEDAATFDWANEKMGALGDRGWLTFSAAVGAILSALAVLWIYPATGYSDDFVAFLEDLTDGNSHLVTLIFGIIFPITHSGLASLRPYGEKIVGARTWRVIFAWPSLCLAYSWITYFVSHAHDGVVLWDGTQIGWLHALAWCINFASFFIYIYITLYIIMYIYVCMYSIYIYYIRIKKAYVSTSPPS